MVPTVYPPIECLDVKLNIKVMSKTVSDANRTLPHVMQAHYILNNILI